MQTASNTPTLYCCSSLGRRGKLCSVCLICKQYAHRVLLKNYHAVDGCHHVSRVLNLGLEVS
ncbi:uncharacterized protein DS421_9g260400 [Arachis hypogaea]|nr:uncharacterized protein DS421_9g260400 [Arachis hypogaea]